MFISFLVRHALLSSHFLSTSDWCTIQAANNKIKCCHCHLILEQILWTRLSRTGQLQPIHNFDSCHVLACPKASAPLNPTCCVVSVVPVTDSSWGYFLPLCTVWAFWTDGSWLDQSGELEWQWLTAWWPGWLSDSLRWVGGDRWATVPHWVELGRDSADSWPMEHQCHRLWLWLTLAVCHPKGQTLLQTVDHFFVKAVAKAFILGPSNVSNETVFYILYWKSITSHSASQILAVYKTSSRLRVNPWLCTGS